MKKKTNKPKRRATSVTFAPLPPPSLSRSSLPSNMPSMLHKPKEEIQQDSSSDKFQSCNGFRGDYSLGDVIRSDSHMMKKSTSPEHTFQLVNSLQKHDFAFVKRSDGSYSYAILAFRSLEPSRGYSSDNLHEYMAFVMCGSGSIKMLKRDQWVNYIRLPSLDGIESLPKRKNNKQKNKGSKKKRNEDDWVPPCIISFIPTSSIEDDDIYGHNSW